MWLASIDSPSPIATPPSCLELGPQQGVSPGLKPLTRPALAPVTDREVRFRANTWNLQAALSGPSRRLLPGTVFSRSSPCRGWPAMNAHAFREELDRLPMDRRDHLQRRQGVAKERGGQHSVGEVAA